MYVCVLRMHACAYRMGMFFPYVRPQAASCVSAPMTFALVAGRALALVARALVSRGDAARGRVQVFALALVARALVAGLALALVARVSAARCRIRAFALALALEPARPVVTSARQQDSSSACSFIWAEKKLDVSLNGNCRRQVHR
jgi:hypothetical protein